MVLVGDFVVKGKGQMGIELRIWRFGLLKY